MFDIANQLSQVNKWMAKRWPVSIQGGSSMFSRIMAAKSAKKNRICKRQCRSKYLRDGRKLQYENWKRKLRTWPGQWYFSRLRATIDNLKICLRPIVAMYMKIFLLSVRKKSITENFVKKSYAHRLLLWWFDVFFHLEPYRQRALRLFFRFTIFHSLKKSPFLIS